MIASHGMVHVRANRVARTEIVLTSRCSRHAQTTNSLRADPNLVLECSGKFAFRWAKRSAQFFDSTGAAIEVGVWDEAATGALFRNFFSGMS